MTVTIDQDGCIGCGLCVVNCPEVFIMADDGYAEVSGEVTDDTIDDVRAACEGCPVSVIKIEEC